MADSTRAKPAALRASVSPRQTRKFAVDLARAFAGALIFALPMLMTMELWRIGFYIEPYRLLVLVVLLVPLLTGLSHFGGFEETGVLLHDVVDAFVAIAVAAVMAAAVLLLFRVIHIGMPAQEVVGKIALQTVPGSVGALLARGQLAGSEDEKGRNEERKQHPGYVGEFFLMTVGAIFLGLNVAPTEEIVLLAYMLEPWRAIALIFVSLAVMHGFVYAVEFRGGSPSGGLFWSLFLRFTVAGYAIVLVIALHLLWTFGRTDGQSLGEIVSAMIVLGFPCAVGAAAARLIL